ncbi:MAG: ASCH domain-containing protein [Rubrivivax sp.]
MDMPPLIQSFWADFVASLGHDPAGRFHEAFHFDDNAASADELAALVLAGRKRATAGLLWAHESAGQPLPQRGDLSVVTLFSGQPVCVIETQKVRIVAFSEVDADFAATEGEGDGSLDYWRRAHTAFFGRECQRLSREFDAQAPVVCEEFWVVFGGTAARGESLEVVPSQARKEGLT